MSKKTDEKYTAEEWERLRKRFFGSILIDTEIAKLGQNVGISWPFKGSDETPGKYIEFSFEELKEVPGFVNKMKRIQTLMDILRETLAFDDPFSEMVDTVQSESREDDTFERILAKLEIPPDFPAKLVHFSAETRELLRDEGHETLLDVIHFGQNLARNVVVGGDLKTFLNSLAHRDETRIARHLPYRRGVRGLHLAEAIGLAAADLNPQVQLELLQKSGVALTEEEEAERESLSKLVMEASLKEAEENVAAACAWFTAEAEELKQTFTTSGSPERYFVPLNDARRERVALALARIHFGITDSEKKGFIGRLFGR